MAGPEPDFRPITRAGWLGALPNALVARRQRAVRSPPPTTTGSATKPSAPSPTCTCSCSATTAASTSVSLRMFGSKARGRGSASARSTSSKPEYRLALARDGYMLVRCELAVFDPEA